MKLIQVVYLVILSVVLNSLAWADADDDLAQSNINKASVLIETVSKALLTDLKNNKDKLADKPLLKDLIQKHVIPALDLEGVSRSIVGTYWNELNIDQQQQLQGSLAKLIVNTYATALTSYKDEEVNVGEALAFPENPKRVRVVSTIEGSSNTLKVNYYLRQIESMMGIYDISVNGQQFSKTYRSSLGPAVEAKDFAKLINIINKQG